jgi:hypothetical protein
MKKKLEFFKNLSTLNDTSKKFVIFFAVFFRRLAAAAANDFQR